MNRVVSLVRILLKNAEMRVPKAGEKGRMYMTIGLLAIMLIMVPCLIIVGFVSYIMTLALSEAGMDPSTGILAQIHIMSAFSVIFGAWVIFSIMFFSSDREHLTVLPFKAWEVLLAKFVFAYLAESAMEFLVLAAMFIGYFVVVPGGAVSYLGAVLGIFIIPVAPMAYCCVLGMILLVVLKNISSRKIFDNLSSILLGIFILIFVYSCRDMGGINIENYIESIGGGSNQFTNTLNGIFFMVPMLINSIYSNSLVNLIEYLITNVAVLGLMVLIGKYTYQNAMYTVAALGSGRAKHRTKVVKPKSLWWACFVKEMKVLLREKAYSNNCVYVNLLCPVMVAGLLFWNRNKESVSTLRRAFARGIFWGGDRAYLLLTILIIALAFVISAMNSLGSSAFSREGRQIDMMKYLPVSYGTQVMVKYAASMIITFPCVWISTFIIAAFMGIGVLWMVYYTIIMLTTISTSTFIGLFLDSAHPYKDWDDEYSALRGNLNTFYDMALVMLFATVICGLVFGLYQFMNVNAMLVHIMLAIILVVLGLISAKAGYDGTVEHMEQM